jgi:hypothetical protein
MNPLTEQSPTQLLQVLDQHIEEGRFQRSLALVAGGSGLLSAVEVTIEHYKGSFSNRVMYSPVILSVILFGAGVAGGIKPRIAKTVLPVASIAMLADGLIGFGFHVRGIARQPGGWRLPVTNVVMGPPVFAPLLLGIGGYLGLIASKLKPEEKRRALPGGYLLVQPGGEDCVNSRGLTPLKRTELNIREGRFQRQLCAVMTASAILNGFESLYSLTPPLIAAGLGSMYSPKIARTYLPAISLVAVAAGGIGFYYHARGVVRRPGGLKTPVYNFVYGPPLFAPLLFAATGFMGLLASRLRREP